MDELYLPMKRSNFNPLDSDILLTEDAKCASISKECAKLKFRYSF